MFGRWYDSDMGDSSPWDVRDRATFGYSSGVGGEEKGKNEAASGWERGFWGLSGVV